MGDSVGLLDLDRTELRPQNVFWMLSAHLVIYSYCTPPSLL